MKTRSGTSVVLDSFPSFSLSLSNHIFPKTIPFYISLHLSIRANTKTAVLLSVVVGLSVTMAEPILYLDTFLSAYPSINMSCTQPDEKEKEKEKKRKKTPPETSRYWKGG